MRSFELHRRTDSTVYRFHRAERSDSMNRFMRHPPHNALPYSRTDQDVFTHPRPIPVLAPEKTKLPPAG
jgi:hypothetical protein